jgi:L-methionine (R)-S-oxide reductase
MADVSISINADPGQVLAQLDALLEDGEPPLTMMANMASLLYWSLPRLNWIGFYLTAGDRLLLGPFHGKPACTVIPLGRGVCGKAALEQRTVNVPDVDAFPGHIACDAASRSELVVPLILGGRVWGVFDADSPDHNRFDSGTQELLEQAARMLVSRAGDGTIFPA